MKWMGEKTRYTSVLEAMVWLAGLGLMAWSDPFAPARFDVCLFDALGAPFCPGEGLGHAIGFLARAEWKLALESHMAAPMVVAVLLHRSVSLIIQSIRTISHDVQGYSIPA